MPSATGKSCKRFLEKLPYCDPIMCDMSNLQRETLARQMPLRRIMKTLTMTCLVLTLVAFAAACGNHQASQPLAIRADAAPSPAGDQVARPPAEGIPADPVAGPPATAVQYARVRGEGDPVTVADDRRVATNDRAAVSYDRPAAVSPITMPAGTVFEVRLAETLDTKHNRAGDRFNATLMKPIFVNRDTVIPRGTVFSGHIFESKPSGRFKGRAVMGLSLDSFQFRGRRHHITTTSLAQRSGGHKKRNWLLIGGGSGLGSAIGAIAGGPAGALIGAGAGAGAGTAGAAFTGRKNVRLPVETPLNFSLRAPVRIANGPLT